MITLSNIHQFTDEQIFNEVERLLKLQGVKSKTETKELSVIGNQSYTFNKPTFRCLYSKSDGSKCAVGLLMDKYDESFEDNTLHRILKEFWPNALPKEPILRILQNIHDHYEPEDWEYVFKTTRASLFNSLSESLNRIIYEYKTIQYT